jgi:hypothetical protein
MRRAIQFLATLAAVGDCIEQLAAENITGGCGGRNYDPSNPNTRGHGRVYREDVQPATRSSGERRNDT